MLACGAPPPGKRKMLQNNWEEIENLQKDTSICFAGVEECRMGGWIKWMLQHGSHDGVRKLHSSLKDVLNLNLEPWDGVAR